MKGDVTQPNVNAFPRMFGNDAPQDGLTKREYFAAVAMQGILAREDNYPYKSKDEFLKSITSISVELADQLIIELNKTN
jgi:hypothetical protein